MRAVVDCFSSVDDECDLAESVLIRRNRATNSPPPSSTMRENNDFGKKCHQQQKRTCSNNNSNVAINPTTAALLCAEMKHIMAGSLPTLDRIRDADDLIRANYGFGDGGFGADLCFKVSRFLGAFICFSFSFSFLLF